MLALPVGTSTGKHPAAMILLLNAVAIGASAAAQPASHARPGGAEGSLALSVESVVRVVESRFNRADPVATSFPATNPDDALVLCGSNADDLLMISTDGGRAFERHVQWVNGHVSSSLPHIQDIGNNLVGEGNWRRTTRGRGVPQGYQTGPIRGPWTTNRTGIVTADRAARNVTFHTDETLSTQAHWSAPPHELVMFSLGAGGVTPLDRTGRNFLATAALRYGTQGLPGKDHRGHCCNNSVVAYATTDGGKHWTYRSTIASKESVNAAGWPSLEGPNENDVVLLADNVTIFSVIRKDGGDGYPSHPHVPYLLAKSTDGGVRWTIREAPHTMMSARPRMVALSNGALVVAGGRPALNLWVSLDSGETFSTYDIPTLHNQNMKNSEDRFCDAFEDANMSLGWAESSCYTQVLALSDDRAMICYERQGRGSGGYNHIQPKGCDPANATLYCMRIQVERSL